MTTQFRIQHSLEHPDGGLGARTGVLETGDDVRRHHATPTVSLVTRRGMPHRLTRDHVETLLGEKGGIIQVSAPQIMTQPTTDIHVAHGAGLRSYYGIPPSCLTLVTLRDPALYEYLPRSSAASDRAVPIFVHNGIMQVSVDMHLRALAAIKPDVAQSLVDEVPATTNKAERHRTAARRSEAWWTETKRAVTEGVRPEEATIETEKTTQPDTESGRKRKREPPGKSDGTPLPLPPIPPISLLAPLLLSTPHDTDRADHINRMVSASNTEQSTSSAKQHVLGYAFCGLGTGESSTHRRTALEQCRQSLPDQAIRVVTGGIDGAAAILEAIARGVDVLCTDTAIAATNAGQALTFPLTLEQVAARRDRIRRGVADSKEDELVVAEAASSHLALLDLSHAADRSPLVPQCACLACRRHHRAYIHHLHQCHEMLAPILLDVHNEWHMMRFMEQIQNYIANGQFYNFHASFLAWQREGREWICGEKDPL